VSENPAAQAVAAGLEAAAPADQFDRASDGERIDMQLAANVGFERGKRASDGNPPIGQLIGTVKFARLHEIDEIPGDRQWHVRGTTRSRQGISGADRDNDGQNRGIDELPNAPSIQPASLAFRKTNRSSRTAASILRFRSQVAMICHCGSVQQQCPHA